MANILLFFFLIKTKFLLADLELSSFLESSLFPPFPSPLHAFLHLAWSLEALEFQSLCSENTYYQTKIRLDCGRSSWAPTSLQRCLAWRWQHKSKNYVEKLIAEQQLLLQKKQVLHRLQTGESSGSMALVVITDSLRSFTQEDLASPPRCNSWSGREGV